MIFPASKYLPTTRPSSSSSLRRTRKRGPPAQKTDSVPQEERTASGDKAAIPPAGGGKASKQTYPLYPSVAQLLHEHGFDSSKADEIPATGPKGRLLKGDVLVFLGKAKADAAANGQAVYDKLAHLDLSNIKVAEMKAKAASPLERKEKPVVQEAVRHLVLPISFKEVVATQKKLQDTLDVFVPLSTFVARAMDIANDALPLPQNTQPSANELFNQVLGLEETRGPQSSRGHYVAQISGLPPVPAFSQTALHRGAGKKQPDIIDLLTGSVTKKKQQPAKASASRASGLSTGLNAFRLDVPEAETARAITFLERVKDVLEKEPGRLVL